MGTVRKQKPSRNLRSSDLSLATAAHPAVKRSPPLHYSTTVLSLPCHPYLHTTSLDTALHPPTTNLREPQRPATTTRPTVACGWWWCDTNITTSGIKEHWWHTFLPGGRRGGILQGGRIRVEGAVWSRRRQIASPSITKFTWEHADVVEYLLCGALGAQRELQTGG